MGRLPWIGDGHDRHRVLVGKAVLAVVEHDSNLCAAGGETGGLGA